MSNNIDEIVSSMNRGEKKYIIDDMGNIIEVLISCDVKTKFYIDDQERIMEKCPGTSVKFTGYVRDKGKFYKK